MSKSTITISTLTLPSGAVYVFSEPGRPEVLAHAEPALAESLATLQAREAALRENADLVEDQVFSFRVPTLLEELSASRAATSRNAEGEPVVDQTEADMRLVAVAISLSYDEYLALPSGVAAALYHRVMSRIHLTESELDFFATRVTGGASRR